jgi:hypothetical protein
MSERLEPGAVVERGGRQFKLLRREPYVRVSDGQPSELLFWDAICATCGGQFLRKSGPEPALVNLDIANCTRHRNVRTARQREAVREANRRRRKELASLL